MPDQGGNDILDGGAGDDNIEGFDQYDALGSKSIDSFEFDLRTVSANDNFWKKVA